VLFSVLFPENLRIRENSRISGAGNSSAQRALRKFTESLKKVFRKSPEVLQNSLTSLQKVLRKFQDSSYKVLRNSTECPHKVLKLCKKVLKKSKEYHQNCCQCDNQTTNRHPKYRAFPIGENQQIRSSANTDRRCSQIQSVLQTPGRVYTKLLAL
jgi:hypothetical protein